MRIPSEIAAGDSASWDDDATTDNLGAAIGPADYVLTYALRGATVLTLTALTQGSGWRTSITTVQSAALTAGIYYWQAYATKTGARVMLGSGQITIKPNLSAQVAGYDGRSQIKQDYDAVVAAIRAMVAGGAVAEYTIQGRSMRKIPVEDLIVLRDKLKAELVREERAQKMANGLGDPNNLKIRFSR